MELTLYTSSPILFSPVFILFISIVTVFFLLSSPLFHPVSIFGQRQRQTGTLKLNTLRTEKPKEKRFIAEIKSTHGIDFSVKIFVDTVFYLEVILPR